MIPFQPCWHYECQNRNNAGYCKLTVCINPKYNGSTNTVVGYIETKPKTNADRIRNMTDEELAVQITRWTWGRPSGNPECGWLEWLKQEVDA